MCMYTTYDIHTHTHAHTHTHKHTHTHTHTHTCPSPSPSILVGDATRALRDVPIRSEREELRRRTASRYSRYGGGEEEEEYPSADSWDRDDAAGRRAVVCYMYLSVCLSVCLSVRLSVCLFVCLSVYLLVYLYMYMLMYTCMYICAHTHICRYTYVYTCTPFMYVRVSTCV